MTRILLIATYPTLSTGYARIANKLGNYLASLPDVKVWHFGFEHYPRATITDRFVDPRIHIIDVAGRIGPEDRFGTTLIKDVVDNEVRPDVVLVYNDVVVTCHFLNYFMTETRPFKIITYLDLVYPWEKPEFLQHIDRWSDRIFTFSDIWRNHLVDDLKFKPEKVGVFRHGFDNDVFKPMDASESKRRLQLDTSDYIILNTNRNSYRKGLDVTIFGFLRFWKSIECPSHVKLFLNCRMDVTDGYDIPNLIRVECMRLGLSYDAVSQNQILTIGNKAGGLLDEATHRALQNASNIGLNTCVGEGFGLCALEGAGLGIPQIVTDTGGLHDIFADLPTSYGCRVVKPRATMHLAQGIDSNCGEIAISDPDDFASALREVYDGSRSGKWDTSGLRKHILATFNWDLHLRKFAVEAGLLTAAVADQSLSDQLSHRSIGPTDPTGLTNETFYVMHSDKDKKSSVC